MIQNTTIQDSLLSVISSIPLINGGKLTASCYSTPSISDKAKANISIAVVRRVAAAKRADKGV
jgi:hypothetical protein